MILSFKGLVDTNDMTDCHSVYSSQILIMNTYLVQRAWVTLESVVLVIYITRNLYERTNMKPPNSASPNIKLRELSEEHIAVFNKHTKQQINMIQCWSHSVQILLHCFGSHLT